MRVVGLTGGIGSGKSTVAEQLHDLGAIVIDADVVARDVMASDQPAGRAVLHRFGTLDRAELADIVFPDPAALADLNAIVHPAVRAEVAARLERWAGSERVVVLVIPLLVESPSPYPITMLVVVDCSEDVALRRLVDGRGMDEADAHRRMAAQADRSTRLAAADLVIDNSGSRQELHDQVDRLWSDLPSGPA